MSGYPKSKDPRIQAYLDHLRNRNLDIASKCQFCGEPTIGINADGYAIQFVCQEHYIPDNPNVVHQIFPEGSDKFIKDKNVGGY